ncbi:MAG: plasmid stabilization protein [Candidatus Vogelbacteria bacterium]|nr:plasmid stabilization protein [Candidatus Vogelbacteria bacterium]
MIAIAYSPVFVKQFAKCELELKQEIKEGIALFSQRDNHRRLKVHKLHGQLKDRYSFSINHRLRIVFRWLSKDEAYLLALGDHDVYKN